MEPMEQILAFIKELEGLKSVTRSAWTQTGRRESTAEHSFRLAVWVMLLEEEFPGLDMGRALRMSLVHDLGERYDGDVSAALLPDPAEKGRVERTAVSRMANLLPPAQARRLTALWEEYEAGETPEARLVKALDKAETIVQHNQGSNPPDFDYAFNLEYGAHLFRDREALAALRRLIDADTRRRMDSSPANGGA